MKRSRRPILAALAILTAGLALLLAGCGGDSDEKEPVIFSDLNWPSAEIQARVASYIVEHGYEYPVDWSRAKQCRSGKRSLTTTRT